MKVFLSHQQQDASISRVIAEKLIVNGIQVYLDVIDPNAGSIEDLSDYLRGQLGECTGLMAVVSEHTKSSWWVPWEIGIATEKAQPITTFAKDNTELPQYLKKWPYLRTLAELDTFIRYAKRLSADIQSKQFYERKSLSEARRITTRDFHKSLKSALGQ